MPKASASQKAGAPAVVVDKSGNRVRLRNIDHALPYCVSTEDGDLRGEIKPNVWTPVPEPVYLMLKSKFLNPPTIQSQDVEFDSDGTPRRVITREESYKDEYILEFSDER